MKLRKASMRDARRLFDWRNDPETRRQCRNTDPIEWKAHQGWLSRALRDPKRKLLIAEASGVPAGTIRADKLDHGWEIHYTVAPDYRGVGCGTEMVRLAVLQLSPPIVAEIKPGNTASKRVVTEAGLRFVRRDNGLEVWSTPQ